MFILPVIDLLQGVVVRGVAGRRESYRPIQSQICSSSDPLDVAAAFRDRFGLSRLYVADLDAIMHRQPNFDTYRRLAEAGFEILVDAGIQNVAAARAVLDAGAASVIAGLESVPSPHLLGDLVQMVGPRQVVFSLDLKADQPLAGAGWPQATPLRIGETAIQQGIDRLIVLDLAGVGVSEGVPTLEICRHIRTLAPRVELITGGGIRGVSDLDLLANLGINGVLIASALHDGRISRRDLESIVTTRMVSTNL